MSDENFGVGTIRAAIADVLDAGWQCGSGCDLQHPWAFPTEMFPGDAQPSDDDLALRVKFMDAVITELQRGADQKAKGQE